MDKNCFDFCIENEYLIKNISGENGGVRTVDKNDSFAVNCIWYYMLDVDTLVLAKLVEKTIFAEGTKYHALWENGGMEDFDETQYIISEENGISK